MEMLRHAVSLMRAVRMVAAWQLLCGSLAVFMLCLSDS
jgi:hypothetical protein